MAKSPVGDKEPTIWGRSDGPYRETGMSGLGRYSCGGLFVHLAFDTKNKITMKKIYLTLLLVSFAVPAIAFASINSNLIYGSRGLQVTELQDYLIDKGFLAGQSSGNFFSLTRRAVIAYQASVGLPATGFVGSMTRAKINADLASANAPAVSAEISETGTTTASSLIPGCSSAVGFSTTTGSPCSGVTTNTTTANRMITLANGATVELDAKGNVVRFVPSTTPQQPSQSGTQDLSILLGSAAATTNSINLSWSTNIPTDSKVFLTLTGGSQQVIPSASGRSTQHFVSVPNLMPNTQYPYTIEAISGILDKKLTGVISTNALPLPTISNVSAASSITQNAAINLANQPLGGVSITVLNQPIAIQRMRFSVTSSNPNAKVSNVALMDSGVVAGPVDEDTTSGKITFTDIVNLPVGISGGTSRLYLSGKVLGAQTGDTITITTNPSQDWVVIGKDSGTSASLPDTTITLPIMVKGPSLSISLFPIEATNQSIPAGSIRATLDTIKLDASSSSEGIRLSSIKLAVSAFSGLSNCYLNEVSPANLSLMSGSNVVNPISNTATFNLDSSLVVEKGAVATLKLQCDISSTASGSFVWNMPDQPALPTGIVTGSSLQPKIISSVGPTTTILPAQ